MPKDWKKTNVTPVFKKRKEEDAGIHSLVNFILYALKVMEHLTLETISRYMKDMKLIRSSQHVFSKKKSFLNNLISF